MTLHKWKVIQIHRKLQTYLLPPLRRGLTTTNINLQNEVTADIVIAGGGMVGTSLCCALGSSKTFQNAKIILLEAGNEQVAKNWNDAPFENRVSSVTPGSCSFLQDIGVWDKIIARRCHPYEDLHVWDAASSGCVGLKSADVNETKMACMVENSVIVESCMERAKELSNIAHIQFNAKIHEVSLPYLHDGSASDLAEVKLENGDTIRSKLLVGADGPNSFIRRKSNIMTHDYDYNQSAVVATLNIKSETSLNNTAWQRFLRTGPIALLPLSRDVSSLVWSTTKQHAAELVQDSEEEFVKKVNEAISGYSEPDGILDVANNLISTFMSIVEPGRLAGSYVRQSPVVTSVHPKSRGMFPLGLKHSTQYVKTRMALVGDAAHRIHPMAGLGVNLGFGDVKRLVESIETAIDEGEDYGDLNVLLPYEADRQRHVLSVIAAINSLHHLFSSTMPPVVVARTLGLHATNFFNPVKNQIIKYAMQ